MNSDPTAPPETAHDIDPPDAAPKPELALPRATGTFCGNCGTPLYGEHCYHCGQPVKGLVRRFSSVLGDIADTLFEIDTRLTRTVAPLLLRPGYLSNEYFAGRRVRYVSPVRLFFFIAVLTFFVAQWSVDSSGAQWFKANNDSISTAKTVEEVARQRDLALQGLEAGKRRAESVPGIAAPMSEAEKAIRAEADRRLKELADAKARGVPPPSHDEAFVDDNGKPWDPAEHPFRYKSLPGWLNTWLTNQAIRAKGNFTRIQQNPNLLVDAWLSALPTTLFLLMPLFAVLLKIAYVFKRRLYMEHFIVALHSHAFLCFDLLLVLVCNGLEGVAAPWMRAPLGWMQLLLIVWMPIYLLLMQKRVYRQGWIMTVVKYGLVGWAYVVLLAIGAMLSLVAKFVWL